MSYDYEKIERLIDQSGLTRKQFFSKIGIRESVFNSWKQGTQIPREDIIKRILHKLSALNQDLQAPINNHVKKQTDTLQQYPGVPNSVYKYVLQNIDLYLHASVNKERHHAASSLRQHKYKKTAIQVIEHKLLTVSKTDGVQLVMLLFYLDREAFMCFCLDWLSQNNINLNDVAFFTRLDAKLLTDQEEKAIVKHISSCPQYDIRLMKYIHGDNLDVVLQHILQYSLDKGLTTKRLRTLAYDAKFLECVQEALRMNISQDPKAYIHWIKYLNLTSIDNHKILQEKYTLFQVYGQLRKNPPDYCDSSYFNIRVIQRILHKMELEFTDWYEIKLIVLHELSINEVDENEVIVKFLNDAYYVDPSFSESMLITVYKQTTLYTRSILDILASFESSFAYRELVSFLLSTKDRTERFKTARSLIKWYPNKSNSILDYVKSLDDEDLLRQINADISEIKEERELNPILIIPDIHSKYQLIPRTVQINELLVSLAKSINADQFFAAVGFAFSSGVRTLLPLISQINEQNGEFELIIGSLQNFRIEKNSKIDRSTVHFLNDLILNNGLKLYTFENSFYHGKFYYIGSKTKAYIIIGSSNISKTAFLDNYELDVLFEVDPTSDNVFLNWYNNLKLDCSLITELNEFNFADLKWNSELDIYSEKFVRRISQSEILNMVSELSDEDVKYRILTWMKYKPSDYFSDLGIPALDGYTLFLYEEYCLGVFESFTRDNAYYVFNCTDVEQLLMQVSRLSKMQMANINAYIGKGYHIQNQDRLQDKIAKYFIRDT